ncbi:MAG: hypothetical protein WC511_02610 [Candidatus Pacearchaeota archaeon]
MTTGKEMANTILAQLGGNKFIAMTGSKNFAYSDNTLSFRVGRNAKNISGVRITLNGKDLYDVQYLKIRGVKVTVAVEENDIYWDMLQVSFTKNTGLDTHL